MPTTMKFRTKLIQITIFIFKIAIIYSIEFNCSTQPTALDRKVLTEEILWYDNERPDSFHEYITMVYGEYPNINYKYDLDMVYKRSDVSFRFLNSYKNYGNAKYLDNHAVNHMVGLNLNAYIDPIKDYEWAEVTRSSTACLFNWYRQPVGVPTALKKMLADGYFEGLGRGWPWPEDTYLDKIPRPYGCWFYMVRGTGVYINVGKTLVAMNRTHCYQLLDIPLELLSVSDVEICPKATEKGYDSVQIYNSQNAKHNELIFCSHNCSTERVTTSCPPLELRTGFNGTKPCNCNSSYPIINCNNKITDALDCYNIKSETYKTKQTCFFEDFNWINEFNYASQSITILFTWVRHEDLKELSKLKSILNKYRSTDQGTIVVDSGHLIHVNDSLLSILSEMNTLQYDILPVRNNVAAKFKGDTDKYKFKMLSLTNPGFLRSTVIDKGGIKIGFISYSIQDLEVMSIETLIQLLIDEALCIKRWADLVILLSDDQEYADSHIASKLNNFVDMILGGKAEERKSCNGLWHSTSQNAVIHSKHMDSSLVVVSLEILSKNSYAFKSNIIEL